jgi:sugar phosphate isomerase/epimerase
VRLRYAYATNGLQSHRLHDAIALLADTGYDGVALTLDVMHLDPHDPGYSGELVEVGRHLDRRGLGSVVETGARYLLDPRRKHHPTLVSPHPQDRARRLALLRTAVDAAAALGSEAVSFWAGVPEPGLPPGDVRRWLADGVREVLAHAVARGVVVALEPEPGMAVEDVAGWRDLADEVADAGPLRLALDVGHCLVAGDLEPDEAIRRHAADLGAVAVEDMPRGVHEHRMFGEGDLDLDAVVAALVDCGVDRLVSVELSRDGHRAHEVVPAALDALRAAEARAARA